MTDETTLQAQLDALKIASELPQGEPVPTAEELEKMTPAPPVDNDHVAPGATPFSPEEIAANATPPEHQLTYLETVGMELADMQIAMLSATEVTFKNGRTLPIVGFTGADGQSVTNLAFATCAHAGDGSVSIPLAGVPISR